MDDATFRAVLHRWPFGSCGKADWHGLAGRLLAALSRHLGVALEFVGNRRHDGDNFAPLIRSVSDFLPAVGGSATARGTAMCGGFVAAWIVYVDVLRLGVRRGWWA
jgi:hypothetical protein